MLHPPTGGTRDFRMLRSGKAAPGVIVTLFCTGVWPREGGCQHGSGLQLAGLALSDPSTWSTCWCTSPWMRRAFSGSVNRSLLTLTIDRPAPPLAPPPVCVQRTGRPVGCLPDGGTNSPDPLAEALFHPGYHLHLPVHAFATPTKRSDGLTLKVRIYN
jgi:hypothetical protein